MNNPRAAFAALAVLAACSSGYGTGGDTSTPVASITITGSPGVIAAGQSVQLAAVTKDSSGNSLTGRVVTWRVDSANVATVSSAGVVTAVAAGAVRVTAAIGITVATVPITVTLPAGVVANVLVTTPKANPVVGDTVQLVATGIDINGDPVPGAIFTWNTPAVGVASISSAGLMVALGPGRALIFATSGTKAGMLNLDIAAAP